MSTSVSLLRGRASSASEVLEAYQAGELSAVLDRTRDVATAQHGITRARALIRLQAYTEAFATISAVDTRDLSLTLRAEAALVLASAAARTGDYSAAEAAMVAARGYAFSTSHRALEMDVLVHEATIAFMQRNTAGAAEVLEDALALATSSAARAESVTPSCDLSHVTARALELGAFIANAQGDAGRQIEGLLMAFACTMRSKTIDLWLQANIAANCAMSARELGHTETIGQLQQWTAGVLWTADMSVQRYHLERSFGLASALRGDQLSAFRSYRLASEMAPSASWRVLAMLDRVTLARSGRPDEPFLQDELEAVRDAADRVDWGSVTGEGYVTLLLLAQAFAQTDAAAAERYLTHYREIHRRSARDLVGHYDPQRRAHEDFAVGLIAAARGEKPAALAAFSRAYDTFAASSYTWRAALVAIERHALAPTAESQAFVYRSIGEYHDSWFAARFTTLPAL